LTIHREAGRKKERAFEHLHFEKKRNNNNNKKKEKRKRRICKEKVCQKSLG